MQYFKRFKIPSISNLLERAWRKYRKAILWSGGFICIGCVVWGYFQLDSSEKREEARNVVYPLLLGVGGVWLNREFQKGQDRRAELDRREQREQDEFKTYLDKMERIIKEGIESENDDNFKIAQALTANVLRELTEERQNQVMFFLDSLNLVGKQDKESQTANSELQSNNQCISLLRGMKLANADLQKLYAVGFYADSADLRGAKLQEADFSEANLQQVKLSGVELQRTNFFGANLQEADLSNTKLFEAIWFEVNLQGAKLYRANFEGASLTLVNFKNAYLSEANFRRASFDESNFQGANLSGANLRETRLHNANLEGANLSASLRLLTTLDLAAYTDLTGSDLSGANLKKAKLSSANFQGANLSKANLQEADLFRVDLRGADLREANLEGAKIHEVLYCNTIMPDGSINNQDCDLR
ncbi:MAG: pentapeptide repeat-containing protein [Spirulina sp. SIO3F2]|nr:pentapeptide repeat-containing protein [Spirulina sp. SIO3F2]